MFGHLLKLSSINEYTDIRQTDVHMDSQCDTIIPGYYHVAGYKNTRFAQIRLRLKVIITMYNAEKLKFAKKIIFIPDYACIHTHTHT